MAGLGPGQISGGFLDKEDRGEFWGKRNHGLTEMVFYVK